MGEGLDLCCEARGKQHQQRREGVIGGEVRYGRGETQCSIDVRITSTHVAHYLEKWYLLESSQYVVMLLLYYMTLI